MDALKAIIERRTQKIYTGQPIERPQLEQLLELATWAPNHRMTQPWRFWVVQRPRIGELTTVVVEAISEADPPKLQAKRKTLGERLPKLGAFIAVSRQPNEDPAIDREDYAACACAIQNLMIGATALGLGSFWSTGAVFEKVEVRQFLGISRDHDLVGSVWLGYPAKRASSIRKSFDEVTVWV